MRWASRIIPDRPSLATCYAVRHKHLARGNSASSANSANSAKILADVVIVTIYTPMWQSAFPGHIALLDFAIMARAVPVSSLQEEKVADVLWVSWSIFAMARAAVHVSCEEPISGVLL